MQGDQEELGEVGEEATFITVVPEKEGREVEEVATSRIEPGRVMLNSIELLGGELPKLNV